MKKTDSYGMEGFKKHFEEVLCAGAEIWLMFYAMS